VYAAHLVGGGTGDLDRARLAVNGTGSLEAVFASEPGDFELHACTPRLRDFVQIADADAHGSL
jgi:hypothetical protein